MKKRFKCPMQHNQFVDEKWCEYVQYSEICEGCYRLGKGRDVSKYQREKIKGRDAQ